MDILEKPGWDKKSGRASSLLLLALAVALLFLSGCAKQPVDARFSGNNQKSVAASVCRTAKSQIGVTYRKGGVSPATGFDCSGFIAWVFEQHGYNLPRTAKEQAMIGDKISKHNLTPGDIVAFKTRGGYHTGIYIGKGQFVHSPRPGTKVRIESMDIAYWNKTYVGARRIA